MVLLGLVFGVSCVYLFFVFILVVVGLFCQYHSQVIGWNGKTRLRNDVLCVEWDVKLYTHLLTHSLSSGTGNTEFCMYIVHWYNDVTSGNGSYYI